MSTTARSGRIGWRAHRLSLLAAMTSISLWAVSVVSVSQVQTDPIAITVANGVVSFDWGGSDNLRRGNHCWRVAMLLFRLNEPWNGRGLTCGNSLFPYFAFDDRSSFFVAPWSSLADPAFWESPRFGLSVPKIRRNSDGIMTAEFQLIYPALIASAWFLIQSFRHRHRSGFCRACGYDLTGIVSGVCPECGIAKPTPQDVKLRRASRKKRLKTVTKWTSGIALGTSLALWWFAANYDFYLPTSGGSNGIEAADGVVSIRVMIPFWWEAPDFSSCDLWKSDGRWGWSLPNWRREGGDQSGAWTAQYVGDMPMWLPTAFLTLSTALLWKWSFRRRILPG